MCLWSSPGSPHLGNQDRRISSLSPACLTPSLTPNLQRQDKNWRSLGPFLSAASEAAGISCLASWRPAEPGEAQDAQKRTEKCTWYPEDFDVKITHKLAEAQRMPPSVLWGYHACMQWVHTGKIPMHTKAKSVSHFCWVRISLCNSDCPGTHSVDQACLELTEICLQD